MNGTPAYMMNQIIQWQVILPESRINADSHNFYEIKDSNVYSSVRLNIAPGGGVVSFFALFGLKKYVLTFTCTHIFDRPVFESMAKYHLIGPTKAKNTI